MTTNQDATVPDTAEEAAARALFAVENCDRRQMLDVESNWRGRLNDENREEYRILARAALSAAAPIIAAQAKAEDLGKLADDFDELASRASYGASEDVMETWLEAATRTRATIEGATP